MAESKAPSAEDIAAARQKIEAVISRGMAEAEASGKKLLVVAGEQHLSRDTLLLESIALDVAEKHGIRNFAPEANANILNVLNSLNFDKLTILPLQVTLPFARDVLLMHVVPIELPSLTTDLLQTRSLQSFLKKDSILEREKYMFDQISETKDHTIAINGIAHLPGYLESEQLKKDYVIVALDLDNTDIDSELATQIFDKDNLDQHADYFFLKDRFDYLMKSKNITAVTYEGDAREMRLWDVVASGLGTERTELLKRTLEKEGRLYPQENLESGLKALNDLLFKNPDDAEYFSARGTIHSQLGNYEAASNDYLEAIIHGEGTQKQKYERDYIQFLDNIPPSVRERLEKVSLSANFTPNVIGRSEALSAYNANEQMNAIPQGLEKTNPGLYEHLWNGGVSEFIAAGKATFKQLETMYRENPESLYALRHSNFIQGVKEGYITVEQVGKLSEAQLKKLESGPSTIKLREAIEGFIGKELSPPMPKIQPEIAPQAAIFKGLGAAA